MKTNRKLLVSFLALLIVSLTLIGCNRQTVAPSANDSHVISVSGSGLPEGAQEITLGELKKLKPFEGKASGLGSSNEETSYQVVGAKLSEVLAKWGVELSSLQGVRLIAADDYSVEVPGEMLQSGEIVLSYLFDGKELSPKDGPVRAVVPGQRTMYWVRNLKAIELLAGTETASANELYFFESVVGQLPSHDYTYYESLDKAIKVEEMLALLKLEGTTGSAHLLSTDGFDKNEQVDVLKQGYLKHSGKDVPAFLAPDLPKGMHVKNIFTLAIAETTIVSFESASQTIGLVEQGDLTGLTLDSLLQGVGLISENGYQLEAADGYSVEVSAADVTRGLVYLKDGVVRVIFDGLPKNTSVKGLYRIKAK